MISREVVAIVAQKVQANDLKCASTDSTGILDIYQKERMAEAGANKSNSKALPELSPRSVSRYVSKVAPVSVARADNKNERRVECLADLENALNTVVLTSAIIEPTADNPFGRFNPRYIFNTDAVTKPTISHLSPLLLKES